MRLIKHRGAACRAFWITLALLGSTVWAAARDITPNRDPDSTPVVAPGQEAPAQPADNPRGFSQAGPGELMAILLSGKYVAGPAGETNPFTEELQAYARLLTGAGVHVVQFDETNGIPDTIVEALREANIVVYSGPADPLVGDWSLPGGGPSLRQMVQNVKLAKGTIVIAHSEGLLGTSRGSVSPELARFRAALYSGRFMLMGAECYFATSGPGGLSFLHDILSGVPFDMAYTNTNDGGAQRTVFRKHPYHDRRTLGLHMSPDGRRVLYDNVFAGGVQETLGTLFPAEAAHLTPLPAFDPVAANTARRTLLSPQPMEASAPYSYLSRGQYIASSALSYCGSRYFWGGTTPARGFDCSGLVQYVCRTWGLVVPRLAGAQFHAGSPVTVDNLVPGDLIFLKNTYKPGLSHVGIYIGNGRFVNAASTNIGVVVSDLDSNDSTHWAGARRLDFARLPRIAGEPPLHPQRVARRRHGGFGHRRRVRA